MDCFDGLPYLVKKYDILVSGRVSVLEADMSRIRIHDANRETSKCGNGYYCFSNFDT